MSSLALWTESNFSNLDELKQLELFEVLKEDVKSGDVFPAFKEGSVNFYFQGQKLFGYTPRNGFQTNIEFLPSVAQRPSGEITESDFKRLTLPESFVEAYDQIKGNVARYRKGITVSESGEVSDLLRKNSYCRDGLSIVGLDIELSLPANSDDRTSDQIDLTLYNVDTATIRMFEVKTYKNKEIWPNGADAPEVAQQLSRYKKQVLGKNSEVLELYKNYIEIANRLFDLKLPEPMQLDSRVDLVVFGFNRDEGKILNETCFSLLKDFKCHKRGSADGIKQETLNAWWNKV